MEFTFGEHLKILKSDLYLLFHSQKNLIKMGQENYFVHTNGICESSNVGKDSKIWAFTHVLPGAIIGSNCNICDHVFIENDVKIGRS